MSLKIKAYKSTVLNSIFPEHYQDLRKSGLSIRTILKAGLKSVTPDQIAAIVGFCHPKVESGLLFPSKTGSQRCKLFPRVQTSNGTMSYCQKKSTPPRLYIPIDYEKSILEGNNPLWIVEGEKKCLAAIQNGVIPSVAISGVWSFLHKGRLIQDLRELITQNRKVIYVPDSDVWSLDRSDLLKSVYDLGREVEDLGGDFKVIKLDSYAGIKIGLDDYFIQYPQEDLLNLGYLSLTDQIFLSCSRTYESRKEKRNKRNNLSSADVSHISHNPGVPVSSKPKPDGLKLEEFYGLAGEYVRLIAPQTEADPHAVFIQFLTIFGNVIGRKPYFLADGRKHHTNLYMVIVGDTSKARKGTSWAQAQFPFKFVCPMWISENVISGLSSGEGLVSAVQDESRSIKKKSDASDVKKLDKRVLVLEEEFASVLKVMRREGNTLSTMIRGFWDRDVVSTITKFTPLKATDAHVSIVAHITAEELLPNFSGVEMANGFGNRFLWLSVQRSKYLPHGGITPIFEINRLNSKLRSAIRFAKSIGEIERSDRANRYWEKIYYGLSEGKTGVAGNLLSRGESQVMRLACLLALLDMKREVYHRHLEAAYRLWRYCEDSVSCIFEKRHVNTVEAKIIEALKERPDKGLTSTEVSKLFYNHADPQTLKRNLEKLVESGLVKKVQKKTGGRRAIVYKWAGER